MGRSVLLLCAWRAQQQRGTKGGCLSQRVVEMRGVVDRRRVPLGRRFIVSAGRERCGRNGDRDREKAAGDGDMMCTTTFRGVLEGEIDMFLCHTPLRQVKARPFVLQKKTRAGGRACVRRVCARAKRVGVLVMLSLHYGCVPFQMGGESCSRLRDFFSFSCFFSFALYISLSSASPFSQHHTYLIRWISSHERRRRRRSSQTQFLLRSILMSN